ncbi:MAG: hypothetical protein D6798_09195 [Deltaproteobacteria bacterium]|nr:MAG: hypothetical protein D6798_09195 [Deltaproteobacteria bacterium]
MGGGLLGVGIALWLGHRDGHPGADRQMSDVHLAAQIEDLVEGIEVEDGVEAGPGAAGPAGVSNPGSAPGSIPVGAASASVAVEGDADAVFLVSDSRRYEVPGAVPAGTWHIEARFGDGAPIPQGSVRLGEGDHPVIACTAAEGRCRVR